MLTTLTCQCNVQRTSKKQTIWKLLLVLIVMFIYTVLMLHCIACSPEPTECNCSLTYSYDTVTNSPQLAAAVACDIRVLYFSADTMRGPTLSPVSSVIVDQVEAGPCMKHDWCVHNMVRRKIESGVQCLINLTMLQKTQDSKCITMPQWASKTRLLATRAYMIKTFYDEHSDDT